MKPYLTLCATLLLTVQSVARAADLVVYPPVPGLAASGHTMMIPCLGHR